ncbi:hypothetical protein BRAO375_1960013 [Bradyrhizobium sp. ORS 375]|nr:hypothetical protein BRAO375_1960013 [Bradyrhizobium sp. ORS 375]
MISAIFCNLDVTQGAPGNRFYDDLVTAELPSREATTLMPSLGSGRSEAHAFASHKSACCCKSRTCRPRN